MASRVFATALRAASRRAIVPAVARPVAAMASANLKQTAVKASMTPMRGYKTLNFGGVEETVYERSDVPREKLLETFKDDTIAVLGYGPQGRGQALNLRDNGVNVIIGQREGKTFNQAVEEGWVPGKNLFPILEATEKATVVMNLLSDAYQKAIWPEMAPLITPGKTLYFSHGFSIVYKDQTDIVPPKDVDVILVAPKGSGFTVRRLFQEGRGINSSFAVYQDASGKARDRTIALGIGIGSGYMYETTFEKEVYSDLFGERGVLMGAIQGLFQAQYEVLRANGHSPSEAFNETVEEATQSLYPLIGERGMDWMYSNCSTTAQRGALDWWRPFHDASKPIFEQLYASVRDGSETARSLDRNSQPDYREKLEEELKEIRESEIWRAGKTVRQLRPENVGKN
ncbi:ketol-acid reductoisomerase [Lichtheimia corymbifera JMRC:FSU:9682]|uniref:ketol-acid reductoisomerase (NADP(+)) n=2 Tax=Lichtheimia TaxID=688353 RepID=A0A068SF01_9FUNG|nr:ketol-acid reductoisomerase [Lichtheimia ornata]KAJ8658876.1 ketol-acid reductoisomerase [Lichtheimia ornata]CDH60869.1 ketol-acid reductoisomerase [Lichtheimia corymbifera JMRC:FSU:9682]